jgi:hypothetical protein
MQKSTLFASDAKEQLRCPIPISAEVAPHLKHISDLEVYALRKGTLSKKKVANCTIFE